MFPMPDSLSGATRANVEAQLAAFTAFTTRMVESFEQVIDLNINASKAMLEDQAITARQLLSAKDPQEFLALTAAQAQPTAAKAIAYGRHLASIATTAQAELARTAEEQIAEAGRKVGALVDDVSKNAPPGSENVIAMFKSALGNANAGYEQFNRATKQAVEVMEANMNTAVSQFSEAAEKTTSAASGRSRK
jgi:phasin family protein